jgi:acetyl-CoA acetyltransferase
MTGKDASGRACVVGIGHTEFSRNSGRSTNRLAFEAITAAAMDAGIQPAQIVREDPEMTSPVAGSTLPGFEV